MTKVTITIEMEVPDVADEEMGISLGDKGMLGEEIFQNVIKEAEVAHLLHILDWMTKDGMKGTAGAPIAINDHHMWAKAIKLAKWDFTIDEVTELTKFEA